MIYRGGTIKSFSYVINEFKTAGSWTTASNWSLGKLPTTEIAFINANCTWSGLSTFSGRLIVAEGRTLTVSSWTNTNQLIIQNITLNGSLILNSSNFYFTNFLKFGEFGSMSGSQRIQTRNSTPKIINLNNNTFTNGVVGSNIGINLESCVGALINGQVSLGVTSGSGNSILIPQKITFLGAFSIDRQSGGCVASNTISLQENEKLITFNSTATFSGCNYLGAYKTLFNGNIIINNSSSTGGGTMSGSFFYFNTLSITTTTTSAQSIINSTSIINSGQTLTLIATANFLRLGGSFNGVDGTSNLTISANSFVSTQIPTNFMNVGNLICGTGSTFSYNLNGNQNVKATTYHNLSCITINTSFVKTLMGNTTVNGNLIVDFTILDRNGFTLTVIGTTTLTNGGTIIN